MTTDWLSQRPGAKTATEGWLNTRRNRSGCTRPIRCMFRWLSRWTMTSFRTSRTRLAGTTGPAARPDLPNARDYLSLAATQCSHAPSVRIWSGVASSGVPSISPSPQSKWPQSGS
jgi:hypothetical protein